MELIKEIGRLATNGDTMEITHMFQQLFVALHEGERGFIPVHRYGLISGKLFIRRNITGTNHRATNNGCTIHRE